MAIFNRPRRADNPSSNRPNTGNKVKRFTHSPLTVEHDGVTASIKENGRVTLRKDVSKDEFDEIEVPASLIFKLGNLLDATRKVKWVDPSEIKRETSTE